MNIKKNILPKELYGYMCEINGNELNYIDSSYTKVLCDAKADLDGSDTGDVNIIYKLVPITKVENGICITQL